MVLRLRVCSSIPAPSEDTSLCLQALRKTSELGITGVEIKLGRDEIISRGMRLFLLDTLPSYSFAVHVHLPYLHGPANLASPRDSLGAHAVQVMLESLGFAAALGCNLANTHIGVNYGEGPHIERSARRLGLLSEEAGEVGVEISVENQEKNCRGILNTPRDMETFLRFIPDSAITYDPGHGNTHGFGPRQFLPVCLPNLRYLHLHDNGGEWDQHLPLGKGNIDFEYLIGQLGLCGKSMEMPATLELAHQDLEQSLGYLRRLARGRLDLL